MLSSIVPNGRAPQPHPATTTEQPSLSSHTTTIGGQEDLHHHQQQHQPLFSALVVPTGGAPPPRNSSVSIVPSDDNERAQLSSIASFRAPIVSAAAHRLVVPPESPIARPSSGPLRRKRLPSPELTAVKHRDVISEEKGSSSAKMWGRRGEFSPSSDTECDDGPEEAVYRDYSHVAFPGGDEAGGNGDLTEFPHCSNGNDQNGGASKDPPFPSKLHRILANPAFADIVSWLPHGRAWKVLKPKAFEERVVPVFFRHCRYSSFMRQVNGWGFKRVSRGKDSAAYYHELFLRGLPKLSLQMRRPASRSSCSSSSSPRQNATAAAKGGPPPDFYQISERHPLPEYRLTPDVEMVLRKDAERFNSTELLRKNRERELLFQQQQQYLTAPPPSSLAEVAGGTSSSSAMMDLAHLQALAAEQQRQQQQQTRSLLAANHGAAGVVDSSALATTSLLLQQQHHQQEREVAALVALRQQRALLEEARAQELALLRCQQAPPLVPPAPPAPTEVADYSLASRLELIAARRRLVQREREREELLLLKQRREHQEQQQQQLAARLALLRQRQQQQGEEGPESAAAAPAGAINAAAAPAGSPAEQQLEEQLRQTLHATQEKNRLLASAVAGSKTSSGGLGVQSQYAAGRLF